MKLMTDTCSLTNYLLDDTSNRTIKVGDSFVELMWSDRNLYKVTRIDEHKTIYARRVETRMKHWEDGTEYPELDEKGEWKLCDGDEIKITKPRKHWKKNDYTTHIFWGATTGYTDPHF